VQLESPPSPNPAGLGGTLRVLATLLIAGLATLGILVVLGIVPRAALGEWAGRLAAVAGIAALAIAAIVGVLRAGRGRS
jgi:hypothetical protein